MACRTQYGLPYTSGSHYGHFACKACGALMRHNVHGAPAGPWRYRSGLVVHVVYAHNAYSSGLPYFAYPMLPMLPSLSYKLYTYGHCGMLS